MNKQEIVVAQDVAESEFERFIEGMDICSDASELDAEDLVMFNKQKNRIINAIKFGHLVIDDNDQAVYTPWRKASGSVEPITFHERTGLSLMAMDKVKKGQDVKRTYATMAEMTKTHPSMFAKLSGSDIKICEALFALLMD